MIFYNLKLIFRRIQNGKGLFTINLFGLVIGITSFLILFLFVNNEKSFDKHIDDHQNIYRVHTIPEGSEITPWARSLGFVLPASRTLPEVEDVTQFSHSPEGTLKFGQQSLPVMDVLSVDEGFFRIFSIKMINGNYKEISKPNVVFISESTAKKYFKDEDPIGKTIELEDLQYDSKAGTFEIRGVVKDMHSKTHFRYDILTSQKGNLQKRFESLLPNYSRTLYAYHYVKLKNNINPEEVANKYKGYFDEHCDVSNLNLVSPDFNMNLQSITNIHLKSDYQFELKENSNKINVGLFVFISFIVLFISLFNFINLSIVTIIKRSKEFGLVKFLGANDRQFIFQILVEILLKSALAICISLFLIEIIKPLINNFFDFDFKIFYSEPLIYLSILGIELLTLGLTAGFVGFFFFGKIKASDLILTMHQYKGNQVIKILLVVQVAIVIFLLSSILFINRQLNYVLSKPLGFNKENVLIVNPKDRSKDPTIFADELRKQSQVVSVGLSNQYFGYPALSESLEGFGLGGNIEYVRCDLNYIQTMNIELKENWIDPSSGNISGIIINDHFYKQLIGKFGSIEAYNTFQKKQDFNPNRILSQIKIVGVAKDFNFSSAHVPIGNFAFLLTNPRQAGNFIHVRLAKNDLREAIKKVEEVWNRNYEGQPFDYFFLDLKIKEQYKAENILRRVLLVFSLIGITICIIGITVFSLFIAQRRTKEIGIRKVNGARISEVLIMLNKGFVKWVAISFVIATPIAYYTMYKWLENFAYKTNLSWWIFALAGLLALGIALLTVSWQSWRAATRNPVEALRYE